MERITHVRLIICLGISVSCGWVSVRQHLLIGVMRCPRQGRMEASEEEQNVTDGEEKGWSHAWLPGLGLVAESWWYVTSSVVWLQAPLT